MGKTTVWRATSGADGAKNVDLIDYRRELKALSIPGKVGTSPPHNSAKTGDPKSRNPTTKQQQHRHTTVLLGQCNK